MTYSINVAKIDHQIAKVISLDNDPHRLGRIQVEFIPSFEPRYVYAAVDPTSGFTFAVGDTVAIFQHPSSHNLVAVSFAQVLAMTKKKELM